jgi:hypothetical protein
MKHKCATCDHEFELGLNTLPECPECIRSRMIHSGGLSIKHTPSGAAASSSYASYIADGVNPITIYDYMANGPHTAESGCVVYKSTTHNSLNAISYKPLGDIPGSGSGPTGPYAAQFAVWVDLEGNSTQGPHLNFEEESHLQSRIANGEWTKAPKCRMCGVVYVRNAADTCLNCQIGGAP